MSGPGQRAAQPPTGWHPPARRDGLVVQFVSEDGTQRKPFDFARLPCRPEIAEDLAVAFEAATGPLGTWKRQAAAQNLWTAARQAGRWLADNHPTMTTLADLGSANARLMAQSFVLPSGDRLVGVLRTLLGYSPVVSDEVVEALVRRWGGRGYDARQPYTAEEFRRITVAARGLVRRARQRLRTHWAMVEDYQTGVFDDLSPRHPRRELAQALDHCARTGDIPRSPATGRASKLNGRAVTAADGQNLLGLLHLTGRDIWAFGVLLTALTGMNMSVLDEMPAAHLRASAPGEPGIALVSVNKPRRGSRSAMTMSLTGLPTELRPASGGSRSPEVLNTSLTTAFGVFRLLTELTEPLRRQIGSTRALVYYTKSPERAGESRFREGLPGQNDEQRTRWLRPVVSGDYARDQVLVTLSLDRLRKTYLEQNRKPVAHTPATLAGYLRRMRSVTEEGFQVVREALDEQVAAALARRTMTVATDDHADRGQDTVLGHCEDFDHSPLDDGDTCRQSFLSCLDCRNARAFPRHLPLQLLVLDELRASRASMPIDRWVGEFAGRAAQLDDLISEYEPAQIAQARVHTTDDHRHLVARLFSGDLDPL
ncbi:hypothetical protein [Alloactinosynnema sp. L-07]|uniref:hypothetical protein n=1 Tax=Alloactinosynnema sp. L-07 TaxID=1653480 RepID=UPI00065F00BA|nr:hypothetical protein [Alloactinosynnema sp. L-07]CRK56932.1 hypothetical protein [Alloactinosynnema sp. L-07]